LRSGADPSLWFETCGPRARELGWPVYPELKTGTKRKPATIQGQSIRPVKEHFMDRALPPEDLVAWWATWAFEQNTAVLSGDAADLVVLDCDIFDPVAAARIVEIADEVFGATPFMRVCNAPKFALVYRRPKGKLNLKQRILELEQRHGNEKQQIEIKDGSALTIAGSHMTTGNPFKWVRGASPLTHRPEDAIRIAEDQVILFLIRVNMEFPLAKFDAEAADRRGTVVEYADTDVSEIRVPRIKDGLVTAEGLKLSDNRKAGFLLPRAGAWAVNNAGIVAPIASGQRQVSEPGVRTIARAMADEARLYIALGCQRDDDLTERSLEKVIFGMVRSAAEKVASGTFAAIGTRRVTCSATVDPAPVVKVRRAPDQVDAEFSWLPPQDKRVDIKGLTLTAADPELAEVRKLIPNRSDLAGRTSRQVRRAIDAWLMKVATWDPEGKIPPPTLLLKAPTGAGKTTALLEGIARFKKNYPHLTLGPILMLLPGYANISEVAAREDLGVWTQATEDRAAEIEAEAGGQGLRVMTFRGKIAAGCQENEKVSELQRRGISSSGLCYKKTPVDTEDEDGHKTRSHTESWCRFHPENPAFDHADTPCENILQKIQVPLSDLILAPHAFIHVNVPTVLKQCRAVVIDERIWDKTLGFTTIPLDTFTRTRGAPPPTKKQWLQNPDIDMGYTLVAREEASEVLIEALRKKRDPAADLLDMYRDFGNGQGRTGSETVEDVLAVTGRGQRQSLEIEPGMDISAIREITHRAQGEFIGEEHRGWTILAERMELLKADRANGKGRKATARGATDARLQLLVDDTVSPPIESLRIAWRRERNFASHPTLFLDASGSRKILEKIWGRPIEMIVVDAPEHRRIVWAPDAGYSKTGLLPTSNDKTDAIRSKAARITLLRDALYTTSAIYGFGGVVAAAAMGVRRLIDDLGWASPANVHWMHFGAIRGLDFAKHHSAAISIGSIAPSWRDIDAYVAALSYDDDAPELPIDLYGNGRKEPGDGSAELVQPVVTKFYPCRDGSTARLEGVADFEAPWAREVYHQIREEELSQFGGRLRAVYREGRAPVWIVLGKVLPEGAIIDEIVGLADLARPLGRSTRSLAAVREADGLVCTEATGTGLIELTTTTAIQKLAAAFEANPRLREGFHEIGYTPKGSTEEKRAWVNAATGLDPVDVFASRYPHPLREPARLTRACRIVPYGQPEIIPGKEVFGLRELALIDARETAMENNAIVEQAETWNAENPEEEPVVVGKRMWVPEQPTASHDERLGAELDAKMVAFEKLEKGYIKWDDKRLGVTVGGMVMDIDTWLLSEQLIGLNTVNRTGKK
tara:strand:+ start:31327 stop:35289 length:3963 start_codon:yes stop_codon:yes gene_type:complete